VCGLIVGDMGFENKDDVKRFDDHFSEMLRIAVFTFLGAQVTLTFGLLDVVPILLFFIAVVLIRPLFVNVVLGNDRSKFTKQEKFVMSFVAPRGIDAAAMAPIVAAALVTAGFTGQANNIMNMVVVVIILTVIFSTIMAKFAASRRFVDGQKPVNAFTKQSIEEKEEDLEDEIESQEEKPASRKKKTEK